MRNKRYLAVLLAVVLLSGNISATPDTLRVIRGGAPTKTSSPIVTDMTVEGTLTYGTFSASGDFTITKATPLIEAKANTDTAATIKIDGGATTDAALKLESNNVAKWALGTDVSDSESFVISSGGTLGTTNAFKATTTGVTIPNTLSVNGNMDVTKATAVLEVASNTDTAATIKIDGGATTDAALKLESNNTAKWSLGTDVSDSEAFVISESGTLGTSNRLKIAAGGAVSFPGAVTSTGLLTASAGMTSNGNELISKATPVLELTSSTDTAANIIIDAGDTSDGSVTFQDNNTARWSIGNDSSASNAFSISASATLGSSEVVKITSSGAVTLSGGLFQKAVTLAADATSIDASAGNMFKTQANSGATAINSISNGVTGQVITILGGSSTNASTLADSGIFSLTGAFTANANDTITLICTDGSNWAEMARADN